MAGHRRGTGKPKRAVNQRQFHRSRVQSAPTGEQQLAAAFAYLRAAVYRHPARGDVLHAEATRLYERAMELEGSAA